MSGGYGKRLRGPDEHPVYSAHGGAWRSLGVSHSLDARRRRRRGGREREGILRGVEMWEAHRRERYNLSWKKEKGDVPRCALLHY